MSDHDCAVLLNETDNNKDLNKPPTPPPPNWRVILLTMPFTAMKLIVMGTPSCFLLAATMLREMRLHFWTCGIYTKPADDHPALTLSLYCSFSPPGANIMESCHTKAELV